MKTMTVFEARNHFARTLEAAKEDVIIVTRNGRPVAAETWFGEGAAQFRVACLHDYRLDIAVTAKPGIPRARFALPR